jgi:hypothetical protein
MVEDWINEYAKEEGPQFDTKDMVVKAREKRWAFQKQAEAIYLNFARIIKEARKGG